jgi:hypothetical protein
MATIPTVPSEKDTTKVSFAQAVVDALSELNAEAGSSKSQLGNGSFEDVESGEPVLWNVTDFAGGSHAISDATESGGEAHHGQRSLQATATGGGGYVEALSGVFLPVGANNTVLVMGFGRRDTANLRIRVQVLYYNENQSLVATDTVEDNADTGVVYSIRSGISTAPSTAHFYKIKLICGESGGSIGGNVFFDGFASALLLRPFPLEPRGYPNAGTTTYTVPDGIKAVHITCAGGGGGGGGSTVGAGTGGGGGGAGHIEGHMVGVAPGDVLVVSVGAGGSGGTGGVSGSAGINSWVAAPSGNFANRYISAPGGGGGTDGPGGGAAGTGWNDGTAGGADGGAGADHVYGTQGAGGTGGGNGGDATGNCAGGGGGDHGTGNSSGGDGADGYIIITPHLGGI